MRTARLGACARQCPRGTQRVRRCNAWRASGRGADMHGAESTALYAAHDVLRVRCIMVQRAAPLWVSYRMTRTLALHRASHARSVHYVESARESIPRQRKVPRCVATGMRHVATRLQAHPMGTQLRIRHCSAGCLRAARQAPQPRSVTTCDPATCRASPTVANAGAAQQRGGRPHRAARAAQGVGQGARGNASDMPTRGRAVAVAVRGACVMRRLAQPRKAWLYCRVPCRTDTRASGRGPRVVPY
jgi:hypothetical protein